MLNLPHRWPLRYGVALLSILLATGLRLLLDPLVANRFPFATLYFAVLVAAWYGGLGPGLAATGLSVVLSAWLLVPARDHPGERTYEDQIGLILFLLVSLGIARLGGLMRAARDQTENREHEALRERDRFRTTLASIGDAIVVTDTLGRVVSLNAVAETVTGWPSQEAAGQPLETVFRIVNEYTGKKAENPVDRVLREGVIVGLANHTVLIARDGTERPIDDSAAPIRDEAGVLSGVVLVFRDITQRRQIERELREQRERLRVTLASIGDGVIATDIKGRVTLMNPVAQVLTGWTEAEALGQPVDVVLPILDELTRQPVESLVVQVLRGGESLGPTNSAILVARDGRERIISDSAAPIQDEEGNILGVVKSFRDVSDRRRAEHEQRHLAAIVASSDDAIYSKTLQGIITSWNAGAERLYGYSAREVVGKPVSLLVPAEKTAELSDTMDRLKRGEMIDHLETTRRRKDGTLVEVSMSVSPVRDTRGNIVGASSISRDIHKQRRDAEAIRRLNRNLHRRIAEFQTLLDVLPVGIAVAEDARCHRVWANPILVKWLGLPPDTNASLSGQPAKRPAYQVFCEGRELTPEEFPLSVATATGRDIRDLELDVVPRDGTPLKLLCYGAPLFDEGGKVRGAILACVDITERVRATEQLREADRRKDEFLAVLSHELRNPLAPIRAALEILRVRADDAAALDQAKDVLERQVQHLVRLVDDLLDVSRIMRGQIDLRKERVRLDDVVARAIEIVRPTLEALGHQLTVELPAEPVTLQADPIRLAQIFGNLLTNAAKYTERPGQIWLTATTADGKAPVSNSPQPSANSNLCFEMVEIRVRDMGIGIAPDMLSRIFELFTQAQPYSILSKGGLGVGLTLVRNLAELHGGTVEAHSAGQGQGSEFIVRLPLALAEKERPKTAPDKPLTATSPVARRRILIVDDNVDAAQSLAMLLRFDGQEVSVAHDGPAALQTATEHDPEVVILDIGMPGMDGYEVARRLRQTPGGANLLLIALTGWGQEKDRRHSKDAGFDYHLTKPLEPTVLQDLLAKFNSRHS